MSQHRPAPTARHPLDSLTGEEIEATRVILQRAGLLGSAVRVPMLMPHEPGREAVALWQPGAPVDRQVEVTLLDVPTGAVSEVIVSVTSGEVVERRELDPTSPPYGQPQYLFEEYERAAEIVKAAPQWQAAMRRRGLGDRMALAFCAPLAPGFTGRADEVGRRVIRSLTFLRDDLDDSPWAHPVEGLVAHLDLTENRLIRLDDEGEVPVPPAHGNYTRAAVGVPRKSLRPIEISQPEGPSFDVVGSEVTWEKWSLRVGFNAREGLVLHEIGFDGRPVLSRASVPEMVVPYGDISPTRCWISYFDAGEYLLGKNANQLVLGCDCLGHIHYFDGYVADDRGRAVRLPNAVCMHEEDAGILWKHTDLHGAAEVRRSRRLVISSFSTIGNYDYGFYWHFYLDGSIQLEVKATGIVFAGAGAPGSPNPHASEIAPGLFTPVHQHLFCVRLEMAVDGFDNDLFEIDAATVPMGEQNPFGNAFTWTSTPLRSEAAAQRDADASVARSWEVRSASRINHVDQPTAYRLIPQPSALLLADPASSVAARAAFATNHLWATAYSPQERWPAGRYPNAHRGGAGLPEYAAADRTFDDSGLVLWHTFGLTHVPRPEDWPIMPVDHAGFWLKPNGVLDRNPALDLPAARQARGGNGPGEGGECGALCEGAP